MSKKKKPERIMFRVERGALVPASELAVQALRNRGFKIGDLVSGEIKQSRNPGFHNMAHVLGALLAQNLDTFESYDAHRVLKRLQWESGVGCEEMSVNIPNMGLQVIRMPQSLSFDQMDQGEFYGVYAGLCSHVRKTYWPDMPEGELEHLAELFTRELA